MHLVVVLAEVVIGSIVLFGIALIETIPTFFGFSRTLSIYAQLEVPEHAAVGGHQ
jgi:hypothetical protein